MIPRLLLLILLYGCMINETRYDYDLQGHRGARGLLPENTIPSFIKAVDLGVQTLELDLVVTAGGELLVSHEPWFNHQISTKPDGTPVTENEEMDLNIYEMTYEEIREYDVGMRGNPDFPNQEPMEVSKPLFRDMVIAIEAYIIENDLPQIKYNVETKSQPDWYGVYSPLPESFAEILYRELTALDILGRVIVQSFDSATLIAMREIDPEIPLAMLVYQETQTMERMTELLGFTPDIWSPNYSLVTEELVARTDREGIRLIPWTVNDPAEMVRLLELGVDGIITDYPNRAP
ncbi:MAG: glycerophosphodiester phosphodiesterase family protein [Bacteroidota bacterium]